MQRDDVDVALDEYHVPGLRLLGEVNAEEAPALAENGRLGAVQVLGLAVAEYAPREGYDAPALVYDREHEPVPEGVVHAAALAALREPGLRELAL